MVDLTTEVEVEADVMGVIHVKEDQSTNTVTRTLIALASKEDLTVTIEEDNEDFNPAYQKRTRRIRTSNTIDVELSTAMAADLSGLQLLGIVDSNGKAAFDDENRKLLEKNGEFLEIAYFNSEPNDWTQVNVETDSELLNRFVDVEITNPEFDLSATPPVVSMVGWVEGGYYVDYTSP